jgi:predicted SAM-dependent methyltransferase
MVGEPKNRILRAIYAPARRLLGLRTLTLLWFDMLRLRARLTHLLGKTGLPPSRQLHVGCGNRRVAGWLNVDVIGSEYDIDLGSGRLPWPDDSFETIVSQHVVEHLELFSELKPLLSEFHRVLGPGGAVWLSCPDMEKICRAYANGKLEEYLADRQSRDDYTTQGAPVSQVVNDLFHQYGEHKNLFDFELLRWALEESGFVDVRKIEEADLLGAFPEFPPRHDDHQTLYVTGRSPA